MKRVSLLTVAAILTGCGGPVGVPIAAGSRPSPGEVVSYSESCPDSSACAPANRERIPDVIGLTLEQAANALAERNYICGVFRIVDEEEDPPTVVSQAPNPGTRGTLGEIVKLDVSGSNSIELPNSCINQLREGRSDSRFWSSLRIGGDDAEAFATLEKMANSADSVVVGRFTSFTQSRTIQGDAPEDVVVLAKTDLEISETLAGAQYGRTVTLEFLILVSPEEADAYIDELNASLPSGDLVVFLRNKGGNESEFFRTTNSRGLWARTNRSQLDTPLASEPPSETGLYERELRQVRSVEQLADRIRRY